MAEFLGQTKRSTDDIAEGFNAMGKPIPQHRRANAVTHCYAMGLTDKLQIMTLIGAMVEKLQRDQPYEAMAEGMRVLDLTGTYRLMAVLLTGDPAERDEDADTIAIATMVSEDVALKAAKARALADRAKAAIAKARKIEKDSEFKSRQLAYEAKAYINNETKRLHDETDARVEAEVASRLDQAFGRTKVVTGNRKRDMAI